MVEKSSTLPVSCDSADEKPSPGDRRTRQRARLTRLHACPDDADHLYQLALSCLRKGDISKGRLTTREAVRRGLAPALHNHLTIEALYQARGWNRLASQVAPHRDFDLPAIETPWIRIAIARVRLVDIAGVNLAVSRHLLLRPGDLDFLLPLAREFDLPRQDQGLAMLVRGLAEMGLDPIKLDAACSTLMAETETQLALDRIAQASKRQIASTSKLARDWARAVLQLATLAPADRPGPSLMEETAIALQAGLDGKFADCASALIALAADTSHPFIRGLLGETRRLIQQLADGPEPDRAILEDGLADVAVSEAGNSRRIAMVFTGLSERVSGLPISVFDRLLARAGYRSIFLRDPSRCAFACGIGSVAENARATVEALRPLTAPENRDELLVIGASGGGYASLRYGLELAADRIAVISGGTVCHPDDLARIGDDRVPVLARRTVRRAGPDDFTRPVHAVLENYAPRPAIEMHYSTGMNADRAHASLLQGHAGVTHFPCANTARHNIITAVLDQILYPPRNRV